MERHHLGVTRNALRENRLVIFGLCSIGLRRHGPFISCHIFLPLCFALSGTHLGSSFFNSSGAKQGPFPAQAGKGSTLHIVTVDPASGAKLCFQAALEVL